MPNLRGDRPNDGESKCRENIEGEMASELARSAYVDDMHEWIFEKRRGGRNGSILR
jgi:hypothetical protein